MTAAQDFWEGALALPFGRATEGVLTLYTGRTVLNVLKAGPDDLAQVGRSTGIALRMRGMGELGQFARRLEAKHGVSDRDAWRWHDGVAVDLTDPDGNKLTLYESDERRDDLTIFEGPSCVAVRVRNLRKAFEFYIGTLELSMLDQPDPNTAILMPGGTNLVLVDRPLKSPSLPVEGETGVCLELDDAERTLEDLAGRGVRFSTPPQLVGKHWIAAVRDPDGNVLTLLGSAE